MDRKVTFKGNPLTLVGREVHVGENAPEFKVTTNDMQEITLGDFRGKNLLVSVVTSLDTSVCEEQTKRFNQQTTQIPGVELLTVSMDLPFAQGRFCIAKDVSIKVASDHRDASFGLNYGVLLKEWRLLARSIFLIDKNGKIVYKEIVPEITTHPNYELALEEAKKL
ncbi:thiol peroxidase [Candidatus Micrarchaeota archaeon]|nr:thiol peroxidase [Candidatus Micrarchaeota archaeon]